MRTSIRRMYKSLPALVLLLTGCAQYVGVDIPPYQPPPPPQYDKTTYPEKVQKALNALAESKNAVDALNSFMPGSQTSNKTEQAIFDYQAQSRNLKWALENQYRTNKPYNIYDPY